MSIWDDIAGFVPAIGAGAGAVLGGPAGMAIGGMLGSSISSLLASKEAQNLSNDERQKLQDLLNKVQSPTFSSQQITPEEFRVVSQYQPQVAQYVQEKAPMLLQGNSADQTMAKDAQRAALRQLIARSQSGTDQISDIQRAQGMRDTAAQNASSIASLNDQLARQGVRTGVGSGLGYAAALQGMSSAADREAMAGQQAAMDAENRRMQALQGSMSAANQLYGQDAAMEQANVNAWNQFNQRSAANQNAYNQYASGVQNDAARYNTGVAQQQANMSTQARNAAQETNLARDDRNKQQAFGNTMSMFNAQNNIGQNKIQGYQDAAKQKATAAQGLGEAATKVGQSMIANQYDPNDKTKKVNPWSWN